MTTNMYKLYTIQWQQHISVMLSYHVNI